jgi:hypothetical protein
MTSPVLPTPASVDRLERRALPVAGLGLLVCAVGLLTNPDQFYRSWLFAFLFWMGMSVGCLSILAISHLTGGMWGLLIRRYLEAGSRLFPLLALLFLPVAAGLGRLYPWTNPGQDPLLLKKQLYLNVPFFLGRAAFYFAVWATLAYFLSRWSRELDAGENRKVSRKLRSLS